MSTVPLVRHMFTEVLCKYPFSRIDHKKLISSTLLAESLTPLWFHLAPLKIMIKWGIKNLIWPLNLDIGSLNFFSHLFIEYINLFHCLNDFFVILYWASIIVVICLLFLVDEVGNVFCLHQKQDQTTRMLVETWGFSLLRKNRIRPLKIGAQLWRRKGEKDERREWKKRERKRRERERERERDVVDGTKNRINSESSSTILK